MYAGRDFSPQETTESEVFGFDFVNDLVQGEELVSSRWSMKISAGGDQQVHLQGPSIIVVPEGSTKKTATIQRIGGLQPGVTYVLRAEVATTLGNIRSLWSHVRGVTHNGRGISDV